MVFITAWVVIVFTLGAVLIRVAHRRGRDEERAAIAASRGQLLYRAPIRFVEVGASHLAGAGYVLELYERQLAVFMDAGRLVRYTNSTEYINIADLDGVSWDPGTRYVWSLRRDAGVRLRFRKGTPFRVTSVVIPLDGSAAALFELLTALTSSSQQPAAAGRPDE